MRRSPVLFMAALAACARPSSPTPAPAPVPAAPVHSIQRQDLESNLYAFAADSFLGRETGTESAVRAARFLAERLASSGVQPAGDSGYLQRVPLQRTSLGTATTFSVVTAQGTVAIPVGELLPLASLGDGVPLPRRVAEGDLVFASYAIDAPDLKRDDLANLDLAGKAVVFLDGAPAGLDSARRAALEEPQQLGERLGRIAQKRPAAIVMLVSGERAAELPRLHDELRNTLLTLAPPVMPDSIRLPMVLVGAPRAASPLLPTRWPTDTRPQVLAGRRFAGKVDLERSVSAYNVIGVVRGRDPALESTYVAFGAHYDHIGIQPPVNGDSIANGADDDGSGSMGLLAIARLAAALPQKPARSMLFVWHVGEEQGLFGSEYFTAHPTVPLDSIVAQLNADMIGRNAPDSLYLVGPRAAPNGQSSVLGAMVDSVNAALPRPFLVNREWDSPTHPEQIYYRSDHFNYARRGIPIVFFTTGLHADYHQVSDEPAKIDYDKLARVNTLIFRSGLAAAERRIRPKPTVVP